METAMLLSSVRTDKSHGIHLENCFRFHKATLQRMAFSTDLIGRKFYTKDKVLPYLSSYGL